MKIIILGCGKVGEKIIEHLNSEKEHDIIAIDTKYSTVQEVMARYDIMGISGNGVDIEVLMEAGISTVDLLIAVTGSDELNLLACLMAKKLGNCETIARIRKPEYKTALNIVKDDLGLTLAINPEYAAATAMARILRFPSAIQIDTFAKGRVEILKFHIPEGSVLNNIKVSEIVSNLDCDILVCGVERENEVFIPNGNFELKSGDVISFVSSIKNATQFFKKIGLKTNRVKNTMIIGGGNTAFYLAYQLLQTGVNVKIIEKDEMRCNELCELLPKADIICGDGTDDRLLLEEGIENTESVVSLTNIDEENILLSLYAKSKMNGKIITKINRIAYDEVIGGLDLGSTICPKNITAENIVRFVRAKHNSFDSNIETLHFIIDGKAEALEFRVREGSPIANISIDKLDLKENLLIACITRNGQVIIPRGRDVILPGDTVVVVALKSGINDISDILK